MKYFISGHRDLTLEEFDRYYKPIIDKIIEEDCVADFVVGDWDGCDLLSIEYLLNRLDWEGIVFIHCVDSPRVRPFGKELKNYSGFVVILQENYDKCDAAMTIQSDFDIAWIRPGREDSHTANNIRRRYGFTL